MIRYFICLSFIIAYINLNSQVYNVAPYSLDEGLHHSQVLDIMQDKRGYLWLGTHRGVSKFDGNNFKVFEARNSEIQGNFVNIILEDRNGDIWVGTEKGLGRYHPYTFKRYKNPDEISGEAIRAMLQTEDGKLWIGGQEGNLYHWQEGKYSKNSILWENKPEEISIRDIEPGTTGRVWIGTTKGLFYFEPTESEKGIQAFGPSDKMSDLLVFDIQHIKGETYWIGTQKGLFSLNSETNKYDIIRDEKLDDPNIYCLAKDSSDNEIWIGTGKGVFVYHDKKFFEVSGGDRMLDVQVRTFLIDREGSTWIGTDGSGMRKITDASFVKYDVEDGFSSKIAKSFLEDTSKNFLSWYTNTPFPVPIQISLSEESFARQ
ncbi:MAG: two-component regulator propeller domain-containing protein [Bacteroidota bacterium]